MTVSVMIFLVFTVVYIGCLSRSTRIVMGEGAKWRQLQAFRRREGRWGWWKISVKLIAARCVSESRLLQSEGFLTNHLPLVNVLLDCGVSPDQAYGGTSPLLFAVQHRQRGAALLMMDRCRPSQYEVACVARAGDLPVILKALESGGSTLLEIDGKPLFWWAILAAANDYQEWQVDELFELMRKERADVNWALPADGDSSLNHFMTVLEEVALDREHRELTRYLVTNGARTSAGWKHEAVVDALARYGIPRAWLESRGAPTSDSEDRLDLH